MNTFELIYNVVSNIPKGKVATYGQIAKQIGMPKSSKVVGYALHANPKPVVIPCHRVVNCNGRVAPFFKEQKQLLQNEGITFKNECCVDLKKHKWKV